MKKTIYYTGTDGGDGSVGVAFYDSKEAIRLLEDKLPEYYRGEGGGSFTVEGTITGIHVRTYEHAAQEVKEMIGDEDDD